MIAIHNRHPVLANLKLILESYIDHQREVITRRTRFQLAQDKTAIAHC